MFRQVTFRIQPVILALAAASALSAGAAVTGRAIEFDGTADYVALGSTSKVSAVSLGLPTNNITVEAWVRVDAFANWRTIVGFQQDNGGTEHGFYLGCDSSRRFVFALAGGGAGLTWLNSSTAYTAGQWHHVCGTYDGTTMRIYVDGVLKNSTGAQSGNISYMDSWYRIGCYKDNDETYYLDAAIDEVRIWNTTRSADQIADNMYLELDGSDTNLFGFYACDETNGTVLADSAGTNTGTLMSMDDSAWIDSYAVYVDKVPTNSRQQLDAVWSGRSQAYRGGGLSIQASIGSVTNSAVFGHDGTVAATVTSDVPASVTSRWSRLWFVEKNGTVSPTFSADFGDAGFSDPDTSDDYVLLYRANTSGTFTVKSSGSRIFDDRIEFEAVDDAQFSNGYYTVGYCETGAVPQTLTVGEGYTYPTIAAAITNANNSDVIEVYGVITNYNILINKDVTIRGQGVYSTVVMASADGNTAGRRIFNMEAGRKATIADMTIRNGYLTGDNNGAGIYNAGTLTISNCLITANRITGSSNNDVGGGGIHDAAGSFCTVSHSEISYNTVTSDGAGINNKGTLLVRYSSIHNNTGSGDDPDGGGIDAGRLTVEHSAIYSNRATWGGAIYGSGTFTATTIHGNYAATRGGAMTSWGTYTLNGCTITGNSSPDTGGINMKGSSKCYIRNCIVAGNTDTSGGDYPDIKTENGAFVSGGYNIIGDRHNQGFTASTGDVVGTVSNVIDAALGNLVDNGGPTPTQMPEESSPAFNAIPTANNFNGAPVTDQRGYARFDKYDIGACEAPQTWLLFMVK